MLFRSVNRFCISDEERSWAPGALRSLDKDFCTAIIANSGSVFKRNVNFARTTATLGKTNASIPRDDDEEEEEEEEEEEDFEIDVIGVDY